MDIPKTLKGQLKFWQTKLKKYQGQYNKLRKDSPDRWWHDEHFDNQMKVLESSIATTKQRVEKLKEKIKNNS